MAALLVYCDDRHLGEPKLMTYTPAPIDTSGIVLPDEVRDLIEIFAKNTHENWAQERITQGWKYGPRRDDARKEHPDLVPYEELPEPEKEFDRNTARETIKAMLASGHRIEPPVHEPIPA